MSLKDSPQRLQQQINFILEMDKLKHILRQSPLLDKSRRENDAEHSWHLAMMVMVLGEYAEPGVDLNHVLRMLLIHDVVEIDAGDTFVYEESSYSQTKEEREMNAAKRLYGLLPDDIGRELFALWQEFEAKETPEAKFAATLDRLQPILTNYFTQGGTWVKYGISASQVFTKINFMENVSPSLWQFVRGLVNDAAQRGLLK